MKVSEKASFNSVSVSLDGYPLFQISYLHKQTQHRKMWTFTLKRPPLEPTTHVLQRSKTLLAHDMCQ
jgi:hypothetical protein